MREEKAIDFKGKLYGHISSLNTVEEPAKQKFIVVMQSHLKSSMKNDSIDFCSTCFTKNQFQWRLKLNPCKRIPKRLKRAGQQGQKLNKLVLTCIVCHKENKQLIKKPKH